MAVQSNDNYDDDDGDEEVESGSGNDGNNHNDTAVVEKKVAERKQQFTPLPSTSASFTAVVVRGSMVENEMGEKKRSKIGEGGRGGGG